MNVQICGLAPAQLRLLMMLLLGEMIVPLLSLTTILSTLTAPFGSRAGVRYIVNCAWIFCNADHEFVEPLLIVKLINHQLINK